MTRVQAKRWCFTLNNFTQEEEERVRDMPLNEAWIQSMVVGEEHLDEGTPHLQGFFITRTKKDFNALQAFFHGRAHLEVAKGTTQQNWKYCTKEGNVLVEHNKPSTVDRRAHRETETEEFYRSLLEDEEQMDRETFRMAHPDIYHNQRANYERVHNEYMVKQMSRYDGRLHDKNLWLYGPNGAGKSTLARSGLESSEIYSKQADKWWDNFDPAVHKRIVVDDFPLAKDGGDLLCRHVKMWGDRFVDTRHVKCGSVIVDPRIPVIITSNHKIDECFSNSEDAAAVKRRYKETYVPGGSWKIERYCTLESLQRSLHEPSSEDDSIVEE